MAELCIKNTVNHNNFKDQKNTKIEKLVGIIVIPFLALI